MIVKKNGEFWVAIEKVTPESIASHNQQLASHY